MHLAYADYLPYAEHPAAVYLYCAPGAQCSDGSNWHGVVLAEHSLHPQFGRWTGLHLVRHRLRGDTGELAQPYQIWHQIWHPVRGVIFQQP